MTHASIYEIVGAALGALAMLGTYVLMIRQLRGSEGAEQRLDPRMVAVRGRREAGSRPES